MTIGAWLTRPVPDEAADLRLLIPPAWSTALVRRYLDSLPAPDPVSATPLDLFLRVGPRDYDIAPMAHASIRTHLLNRIAATVIATPRACAADAARLFASSEVVADEDLLPAPMRQAIEEATLEGRANWVAQQFLSMVYVSTRAQRPTLVWDADTIMTRPQSLLRGDVAMLAVSAEHHEPYFRWIRALLPTLPLPVHSSTVAHHMIIDPALLRELLHEIEGGTPTVPWWRAILTRLDRREASPMADYELYGQWVRHRHPNRVLLVGFRNTAVSRGQALREFEHRRSSSEAVDSISAHWWISEERP